MVTRREVLAALASSAALPFLSACASEATPDSNEPTALTLLNQCAEDLLTLFPESATSLGIDTGNRAGLRAQLADRSESGKQRVADQVEQRNVLGTILHQIGGECAKGSYNPQRCHAR